MPAFRTSGSTGQAPTTIYFGKVPDRLNVLLQAIIDNVNGFHFATSSTAGAPANLVNLWQVYNPAQLGGSSAATSSFGGFITAPDGTTNTMQKLVEGTNNGVHAVGALFVTNNTNGGFKLRVSVFAKAAERTRFALYCGNGFDPNTVAPGTNYGCKTVFDVGGGRVGVANTAFGSTAIAYTPGPTEIVSFGGGIYRCTMDMLMGSSCASGTTSGFEFGILTDNGSGTAAESTNYVGDGSSGLYFWRSTCLPPAAWALNNITYLEDFTSLSGFDLSFTMAPGFNWYLRNGWTGFLPDVVPDTFPSRLSIVGGTQLKIAIDGTNTQRNDLTISSAGTLNPSSGFVLGNLFRPPALLECSMSWDAIGPGGSDNAPVFWSRNIESVAAINLAAVTAQTEFDMPEWTPGGAATFGGSTFSAGPSGGTGIWGINTAVNGIPLWYSTFAYPNALYRVMFNGVQYISQRPTTNEQPDISPTAWQPFSTGAAGLEPQNPVVVDWTQQNVFSTLWLTFSANDVGQILSFFNGRYCFAEFHYNNVHGHTIYSPLSPPSGGNSPNAWIADRLKYPYFFGASDNKDVFVDFIRTTQ